MLVRLLRSVSKRTVHDDAMNGKTFRPGGASPSSLQQQQQQGGAVARPCCRELLHNLCLRRLALAVALIALLVVVLQGLLQAPDPSTCVMVRAEFGLPCEEHIASTADGYTLFLKRIPPKVGATPPGSGAGRPVLLLPGLLDSSSGFLVSGRRESLAGVLHDDGFDVWLLEKRGRAPWRHDIYNGQDAEFWDFSFDEMVQADVPAMVDYVHRLTGQKIASLVGHSEGGMVAVTAVASNAGLAAKVRSVVGLAPPLGSWGADAVPLFVRAMPDFFQGYVHPGLLLGFVRVVLDGFCSNVPSVCVRTICATAGCSDPAKYDAPVLRRIFSNFPRETSFKNVQHMAQCEAAQRLQRFDYGVQGNLDKYGSALPSPYDLTALATPTALYFGTKDLLVPEKTLAVTEAMLPQGKPGLVHVNASLPYGHTDFIWANDASTLLYRPIVAFINKVAPPVL